MDIPENCKLVAIHDGSGNSATWTLCVEDEDGGVAAYLKWPFKENWVTQKFLEDCGFVCVFA